MKTKVWIQQEVEVDIRVPEFIQAVENITDSLAILNMAYRVIKETPDETIAKLPENLRNNIAVLFREQAARYEEGGAE